MVVKCFSPWGMGAVMLALLTGCQPPLSLSSIEHDIDGPTRTVTHAMGTTIVPATPQRVVVLDYAPLDTALALNIQPVGRMEIAPSPIYPQTVNDIPVVGEALQPNLETILQLKPDLILSDKVRSGRLYRQLSQIAPTVLSPDNGRKGEWQANMQLHAEALGQPEQAQRLLDDYQRRMEALQAALSFSPETINVSVIAHWSGGIVAYSADSFPGSVLKDIGFARNPVQGEGKRFGILLSREDLRQIDGDVLFLLHNPTVEGSVAQAEFVSDPLWSRLSAVQQGIVCEVDSANWAGGRSILAANQILTDVETCLAR